MKGGRNTEGYADPTAIVAVGRVAKEEREQIECEAADKRAYDLIKVLKYIIKGAGFELTERCSGERYQDGKGLQMIEKIKKFIRIITILLMTALVIFLIYTVFKYEWKNILCFVSVITVFLIICWAFDW